MIYDYDDFTIIVIVQYRIGFSAGGEAATPPAPRSARGTGDSARLGHLSSLFP